MVVLSRGQGGLYRYRGFGPCYGSYPTWSVDLLKLFAAALKRLETWNTAAVVICKSVVWDDVVVETQPSKAIG